MQVCLISRIIEFIVCLKVSVLSGVLREEKRRKLSEHLNCLDMGRTALPVALNQNSASGVDFPYNLYCGVLVWGWVFFVVWRVGLAIVCIWGVMYLKTKSFVWFSLKKSGWYS